MTVSQSLLNNRSGKMCQHEQIIISMHTEGRDTKPSSTLGKRRAEAFKCQRRLDVEADTMNLQVSVNHDSK